MITTGNKQITTGNKQPELVLKGMGLSATTG
jgi:hypothetical protein